MHILAAVCPVGFTGKNCEEKCFPKTFQTMDMAASSNAHVQKYVAVLLMAAKKLNLVSFYFDAIM